MKFVRAGKVEGATLNDDHRWFHLTCYRENDHGYKHTIDFPKEARSEFTKCFACLKSINPPKGSEDAQD